MYESATDMHNIILNVLGHSQFKVCSVGYKLLAYKFPQKSEISLEFN